jgi:hypothetical protein
LRTSGKIQKRASARFFNGIDAALGRFLIFKVDAALAPLFDVATCFEAL